MMQHQQQVASRSLWVGNIDQTITIDLLTQVFSAFGPIESVRLLVEKECGFVNFFQVEDAIRAKEEILGHMGGRIGHCIVRIGFGKADAAVTETTVLQPTRALCKDICLSKNRRLYKSLLIFIFNILYRARQYTRQHNSYLSSGRIL